jgi:hypothetical protein
VSRGLCRGCGAQWVKRNPSGICLQCEDNAARNFPDYVANITSEPDDYALAKARKLIAAEFRLNGQEGFAKQYEHGGFITNPLRAFAKYIASVE